jgi:predicted membrane channel-forming protein YqfA (hemolysin III family)
MSIQATPATSEETSWIEHQRKEQQEAPRRLEETAKYLSGLSAISLTIMLGPYSETLKTFRTTAGLKLGIVCWLISIVCTLAVVFPFRYRYIGNSESSVRNVHRKITKVKFTLLLTGALFYLTGISIVAYFCLFCPPPK